LFMLSKCFVRLFRKPYLVGSIGLLYGFVSGYVTNVPQVDDRAAIAYLRRQQIGRLFGRESIWR
jgi:biofilm PGA synthesis N-glycosyltransferase PgaC